MRVKLFGGPCLHKVESYYYTPRRVDTRDPIGLYTEGVILAEEVCRMLNSSCYACTREKQVVNLKLSSVTSSTVMSIDVYTPESCCPKLCLLTSYTVL